MCASGPEPNPKPSFEALKANWKTYDAPFTTKVRLAIANNWIKVSKRQDCCGNHGQPGC